MKASNLKKDTIKSVRINGDVMKELTDKGLTLQMIIDLFIDTQVKVEVRSSRPHEVNVQAKTTSE